MARGWESKSIEAQIEDADSLTRSDTGGARSTSEVSIICRREGLMLQRSRILQAISSARNPRYIKMLEEMLNHLESELLALPKAKIVNRNS